MSLISLLVVTAAIFYPILQTIIASFTQINSHLKLPIKKSLYSFVLSNIITDFNRTIQ